AVRGAGEREIMSSGITGSASANRLYQNSPCRKPAGSPYPPAKAPLRSLAMAPAARLVLTGCAGCGNGAPAFPVSTDQEQDLAKPEWGTKRICPSCGTRYYDLLRDQVICPKCSTPYDPEAFLKARRARPVAPVEKELAPVSDDLD